MIMMHLTYKVLIKNKNNILIISDDFDNIVNMLYNIKDANISIGNY